MERILKGMYYTLDRASAEGAITNTFECTEFRRGELAVLNSFLYSKSL
jgi:hypothetical protein